MIDEGSLQLDAEPSSFPTNTSADGYTADRPQQLPNFYSWRPDPDSTVSEPDKETKGEGGDDHFPDWQGE